MDDGGVGGVDDDQRPDDGGEVGGSLEHGLKNAEGCGRNASYLILMHLDGRVDEDVEILDETGDAEVEGLDGDGGTSRMGKEAIFFHRTR